MELLSISQVSKMFNVSTRTLRYYEEIGLISSKRKEDYAYRTYDDLAILKMKQIVILRKLKVSLKDIKEILKNEDAMMALQVFEKNVQEVEGQIEALETIRTILKSFIDEMKERINFNIKLDLLGDENLIKMVNSLNMDKSNLKEKKSMEELNNAEKKVSKLKDVRIVYLPPATVASCNYVGSEPEAYVNERIDEFVRKQNLCRIKPDMRHYGFNNPEPTSESSEHGYEMWVTIPDDMNVEEPLVKKKFQGGLYAAHMIPFGAFEEWQYLFEWVEKSELYDINYKSQYLEEHINYISHVYLPNTEPEGMQLDLLMPIIPKNKEFFINEGEV